MVVDRRIFCAALVCVLMPGCSEAAPPAPTPTPTPARRTKATPIPPWWAAFRTTYMLPEGRIVDTGNNGVSHSEGQSYGMLFAELAGDRDSFDRLWQWTEAKLARPDVALYAWRYDPHAADPVADRNNATDGDLMIAWTLSRAARRWKEPRYAARAEQIRRAIAERLVVTRGGRRLLLPGLEGFAHSDRVTLNPSYYVWPALDAFAQQDPAVWQPVIRDGEAMLAMARFGPLQLPADWIDVAESGALAPASGKPPRFGYDAIRVPLYAAASGRKAMIEPIAQWWRGIVTARGTIPAWIDVTSGQIADYPLSAGGMDVVDRVLNTARAPAAPADYYAAALQCLANQLPGRG